MRCDVDLARWMLPRVVPDQRCKAASGWADTTLEGLKV